MHVTLWLRRSSRKRMLGHRPAEYGAEKMDDGLR